MEQKAFYRILLEMAKTPHKAERYLNDRRLTGTEKKVIEAHLLIRNNKNEEAYQLLQKTPVSELVFVEAIKKLFIAISLINLSRFSEAEPLLIDVSKITFLLGIDHFRFVAFFNLFVLNSNRGDLKKMNQCLQMMESISPLHSDHQIKLLRCQFMFHFESLEFKKADEYLHLLKLRKKELTENDQISLLVSEFKFLAKQENWNRCATVLAEMKKFRKFQLKENFKFMKVLLDHLINESPIYAYEKDFRKTPLLFHQLKVIQSLESSDLKKAEQHWLELAAINPDLYAPDFNYTGSTTLFSACLKKHQKKTNTFHEIEVQQESSKIAQLTAILENVAIPISKDQLFEMIWGHIPSDKNDQKKLVRLIYEAKTERGLEIEYRKGTYFLKRNKVA